VPLVWRSAEFARAFFIGGNMNELSVEKTMTVKEVAEVLQVSTDLVQKIIRKLGDDHHPVKNNQGGYLLNEAQVTAIKLQIEKNPYLSSTGQVVKTNLEKALIIKQAAIFQQEIIDSLTTKNQQLQIENKEMLPKADFYDQVAGSADAIEMREVAAVLNREGWGRNKVFSILRQSKVLDGDNLPYRRYQDEGYFRVVEQKYTDSMGETRISLKTLVYQKGIKWIRRLLDRYIEKDIY
jgi:phage antirepressor YoqD-like protein